MGLCDWGRAGDLESNGGACAMTSILRSRTVWFAIILAVLSVLQGYVGLLPLTPVGQMWVGIGISVIVTVLRIVTTQPLSQK